MNTAPELTPLGQQVNEAAIAAIRLSRDADKWLVVEASFGAGRPAKLVLGAIRAKSVCPDEGAMWLLSVADSKVQKALWAAVILRELHHRGQLGDGLS